MIDTSSWLPWSVVTLATVFTLVILVTLVTLFWSSTGPRVSPFRFFLCLRKLAVLVQWRVASTYYSLQITALPTTSSSNHYLKMRLGFSSNPSLITGLPCHLLLTHYSLVSYNSCFGDLIDVTLTLADGDAYSNVVYIVSDVTVAIEESINKSLGTA